MKTPEIFRTSAWLTAVMVLASAGMVQGQFGYMTNTDNTIIIMGCLDTDGVVNVPSTINGLTVSYICDGAFANCTRLTGVTIPDSVIYIGYGAFSGCSSLTSVTIGNSTTEIGGACGHAFYNCTSLTSVYFKGNAPWYGVGGMFLGDTNVTVYYLPGTTGWGSTFGGNIGYGDAPTAVWNIFSYTTNSPDTNTITITGFNQSPPVTDVTIPNTINGLIVTSVGEGAFDEYSNPFPPDITSVTIPGSVTSIGRGAFYWCASLTNATIPDSVINIGDVAFYRCIGLTGVTIPGSVTNIGRAAFDYCYSLTGVYFAGNAPNLGLYAFDDNDNATVYYLPGTTGWTTNFAGHSAFLWRPRISADSSFGILSNQFGFNINWASGMVAVIEARADLAASSWIPLQTSTLAGASSYFDDGNWTNYPRRFYRIRWQ